MEQVINWFEIPAADLERAVNFYERVFRVTLQRVPRSQGGGFAVFPYTCPATGGCVCAAPELMPGSDGPLIYLDAGADLDGVLSRVAANGGRVVMARTPVTAMVMFHPSSLLRQPGQKRLAWRDLLAMRRLLKESEADP